MTRLAVFALALLCGAASAQPVYDNAPFDWTPPLPQPVVVHVFSEGGVPTFEIEGPKGSNGPLLHAGSPLVLRTSDGLRAMIVVPPSSFDYRAGTVGPSAAVATPGMPATLLAPPPLRSGPPTYHDVVLLVCTDDGPAPREASYDETACATWQALRHDGDEDHVYGFILEINYGLQVLSPAPPMIPDPPSTRPIDPQN